MLYTKQANRHNGITVMSTRIVKIKIPGQWYKKAFKCGGAIEAKTNSYGEIIKSGGHGPRAPPRF